MWWTRYSHFLYRILDTKKTSRFQFSVPDLREIHRNLKQEKNFNSCESFFRKSPFCTFSCINPGFGGPWDKLWKKNFIAIFIMLQKNAKLKNCQNGTFEPVHEIQKNFWPKAFFWNIMKIATRKNIQNLSQGPPNPGFMQEKVQKGDFLKKPSRKLNSFFVLF